MYAVAKLAQAAGLGLIAFGFFRSFPELMDRKVLGFGIVIFVFGWIIERFLLKR